MTQPVVHWEIGARDAAKLRRFYAALFDWEITGDADYGLVAPADGGIGGGILQTRQGMPSYVTFYVGVHDLDASLERAASLGGRTLVTPMPIPMDRCFRDVLRPRRQRDRHHGGIPGPARRVRSPGRTPAALRLLSH